MLDYKIILRNLHQHLFLVSFRGSFIYHQNLLRELFLVTFIYYMAHRTQWWTKFIDSHTVISHVHKAENWKGCSTFDTEVYISNKDLKSLRKKFTCIPIFCFSFLKSSHSSRLLWMNTLSHRQCYRNALSKICYSVLLFPWFYLVYLFFMYIIFFVRNDITASFSVVLTLVQSLICLYY